MLATLSRWRPWVQIPSGALMSMESKARYANWPSGQAQTLASVGSNPTRAIDSKFELSNLKFQINNRVGWALASPGGRNPPAFGLWRFNSVPTHWVLIDVLNVMLARSASGRLPGSQPGDEGSTPSRVTRNGG